MALAPDIVAGVARRLAEHAGLELPAWVIEARTAARLAATGLAAGDYVELIGSGRGAGELAELIEVVRVGESRLFRHRSQIAALADAVAPALRARGSRAIRVWSAGCAAGEEPYTLAIVLGAALPGCAISILGTDVSADALAVAAAARYPAAALDDVPPEWRDAFAIEPDAIRVRPEHAALVKLERANLVDGAAPRGCDLVWCRNVLIYFTPAARRRVIDRLVAATRPGGFVFVGYSETLRDVAELDAVRAGDVVYYVRREQPAGGARGVLVVPGVHRTPGLGVPIDERSEAMGGGGPAGFAGGAGGRAPRAIDRLERTPPPVAPPREAPSGDTLILRGQPTARELTGELAARLSIVGLERLVVDLDSADLLEDELAPLLRRARSAAAAAGVVIELRATRAGTRRWLVRHELDEEGPP